MKIHLVNQSDVLFSMLKTRCFALLVISFFVCFGSASSKEYFDKYYVVVDDAAPFRIVEEWNGVKGYSGIYVDLIKEVSKRTGLELEFVYVPFARAVAMMKSGKADMLLGTVWTAENARFMQFIEASFPAEFITFLLTEGTEDIRYYEDLHGLEIGVLRSARHFELFDTDADLRKFEFTSYDEGARMLEHGRIDAMIIPDLQAFYVLQRPKANLKKSSFKALGTPNYITISKNSSLMKRKKLVEDVFSELIEERFFERLLQVYSFQ